MGTSLRELIVSVTANTTQYDRRMQQLGSTASGYFNAVRDGGAVPLTRRSRLTRRACR